MQKNLILTMLACLNCVHTTHAVEKMEKSGKMNIQEDGQDGLKELERQYAFRESYLTSLKKYKDSEHISIWKKDKLVEQAENFSKMTHLRAKQHMNDPMVQNVLSLISQMPALLKASSHEHINNNFDQFWRKGHVVTPLLNEKLKEEYGLDEGKLYEKYPFLEPKFDDVNRHIMSDTPIEDIKDPVTAKQVKDARDNRHARLISGLVNDHIEGFSPQNIDFLKFMVQEIRNKPENNAVVLNTIRNNLIGEDQELAEKTIALLNQDPVLRLEIEKLESQIGRMKLAKTREHRKKISGPFDKVPQGAFQEVTKYL